MNRLSIENKLRVLLQNCGLKPVLSPVVSVIGTNKEHHASVMHKHIGLSQGIESERMWLNLVYDLQAAKVPGFKRPKIITQYIEEMDPNELIFTGVASGKFRKPGSVIMMIHGDEKSNITFGGSNKSEKWFPSKKLAECISESGIEIGRTILPICNGNLVNNVLSEVKNIVQIVGNHCGDILEENGGMTGVLKDETVDTFFEFREHIFNKLMMEIFQNKFCQTTGKNLVEA